MNELLEAAKALSQPNVDLASGPSRQFIGRIQDIMGGQKIPAIMIQRIAAQINSQFANVRAGNMAGPRGSARGSRAAR